MLGTYRLVLALLVAVSHIGIRFDGLHPGVVAVVGFYLVSGYVMTGLIRDHYARPQQIGGFFLDRGLRLFPQYLAVAVITLCWFAVSGRHTDFLRVDPQVRNLIENLLVVPLNYFMFNDSDHFALIPPAWSLGAEIQFYLLLPLLLFPGLRAIAILGSVAVYGCAQYGLLDPDWFGYRLLPGVLFMFLLGSVFHDRGRGTASRRRRAVFVTAVIAGVGVHALALLLSGRLRTSYNRETLLGLVAGILCLQVLVHCPRRALDEKLGNLSYGVFLNHFLVKWTVFDGHVSARPGPVAAYLAISILLAALFYRLVEKPALALRRRLRTRPPSKYPDASPGRRA